MSFVAFFVFYVVTTLVERVSCGYICIVEKKIHGHRVYHLQGNRVYLHFQGNCFLLGVPSIALQILSSPELRRSGFAGVHKFRIVTQYRSPSNP